MNVFFSFSFVFLLSLISVIHGGFLHQVKGLSGLLRTNLELGINEDEADLLKRRNAFGSNTYPRKKGRSFWVYYLLLSSYSLFCSCNYGRNLLLAGIDSYAVSQRFLWEAWQDLTLIILIIAAAVSLGLGIKTEV